MKFQIPQFIDVEDKIFGPLTLKQFIYVAGGASAVVICVLVFGTVLGILISAPIAILAAALAFYKINNRPFIYALESALKYFTKDKLYIWKKSEEPKKEQGGEEKSFDPLSVPNLSGNKLKDMNWELDVKKKDDELLKR